MKTKIFKSILFFLLCGNALAWCGGDDNVLKGAIFGGQKGVCASIAKIITQPVELLEGFLKCIAKLPVKHY